MKQKIYSRLKQAANEKEVEREYKNEIESEFTHSIIKHHFKCDGYLEEEVFYDSERNVLRLLMEFKYNKDFNKKSARGQVLLQVLYYVKKFQEIKGEYTGIPNIILAGDEKTCFIIKGESIYKYLNYNIDWSIAPSEAYKKNQELVNEIADNEEISPYIFTIEKSFTIKKLCNEIRKLLMGIKEKYKITDLNILKLYDYFLSEIIDKKKNYDSSLLVNTFINVLIDDDETYRHPKKRGLLKTEKKEIAIDTIKYNAFVERYSHKYGRDEVRNILAYRDRLIEDTDRRKQGEFYTPTIWAERSKIELDKVLGEKWIEKFAVWDCAWGTGNLTRDYEFKNLYCSTLRDEDIKMGEINNREAIKFKYDFLNDGVMKTEEKIYTKNGRLKKVIRSYDYLDKEIPKTLLKVIKNNEPILIYINPPYGEASNSTAKNRNFKDNITKTKIAEAMNYNKIGGQQQLYNQFIYRILQIKKKFNLTNLYIGIFIPPLLLTGPKVEKLRSLYLNEFEFLSGFAFSSSNFDNVNKEWAVSFTIWKCGKTNTRDFKLSIEKNTEKGIEKIKDKIFYSLKDNELLSKWNEKVYYNQDTIETFQECIMLKSGLNKDNKNRTFKKLDQEISYLISDRNSIYGNIKGVYLLNTKISAHLKTISINKKNIDKAITIFALRAVMKSSWENQKDEYLIPKESILSNERWLANAYVYSIFSSKSQQTSLREIKANDKSYNVTNQWFFMSNKQVEKVAQDCRNRDLELDCIKYKGERYIYQKLESMKIEGIAKEVLDFGKKLTIESIKYREEFNSKNEKCNINSWDAGWFQIRRLLKEYNKIELKKFDNLLKKLEKEIIKDVYNFGALKR